MPSRQKLLNAAAASVTGVGIKFDCGVAPVAIKCQGGYTTANGVNIQGSFDSTNGVDGIWANLEGTVVTPGGAATEVKELVNITDTSTIQFNYRVPWIRATTTAGMVGNATVYINFDR
jgi:hypothetical protein